MKQLLARPEILKTEKPASAIAASDYVTLSHGGWACFRDQNVEERYRLLLRNEGTKWSATRLECDRLSANFQGNPLWPHQVLVGYVALSQHFGLANAHAELACLIPDSQTVNSNLRRIGLKGFSFKELTSETMSDQAYVDGFIDEKCLPMAPAEDRDSVHDWSYHFLTLMFEDFLENVRLNLCWIRSRLDSFPGRKTHRWNYYGHRQDEANRFVGECRPEEMEWTDAIYRQMAISLDVCTAKIVQILCMEQRGLLDKCLGELEVVTSFANGVTSESLARILWLEQDLPAHVQPPLNVVGRSLGDCAMTYLRSTLADLEAKSTKLNEPDIFEARKKFFTGLLCVQA